MDGFVRRWEIGSDGVERGATEYYKKGLDEATNKALVSSTTKKKKPMPKKPIESL